MKDHLTIGSLFKGYHKTLAILIEIDFVLEDTSLFHVFIGCTQDSDKVVHEKNVTEEYIDYLQNGKRKLPLTHILKIELSDGCIEKIPGCNSQTTILFRVSVLVKSGKDRGHDQDKADHDKHKG